MKEVTERFFCREIQYAHMICAVDHGSIIATHTENPYKRKWFQPVPHSQFYFWDCEIGSVLKLTVEGVTKLIAFRVSEALPKQDISFEDDEYEKEWFPEWL